MLETSEGSYTDSFVDFDDLVEGIEPEELDLDIEFDKDQIAESGIEDFDANQIAESGIEELDEEINAAAVVVPAKKVTKMDLARAIFNEEVEKAKPNKHVRKTVIDRFKAEAGFGDAYSGTAYQNITKELKKLQG